MTAVSGQSKQNYRVLLSPKSVNMNFNAKSTIFSPLNDPNAYYFSGLRDKILDSRGGRRYGTLKKAVKHPTNE
jgi:hypothetical protein